MHSISWKRFVLAIVVLACAWAGVPRPDHAELVRPLTVFGQFKDRPVRLTATPRSAGAIESLEWDGVEFLDSNDHGRDLQSAVVFDGSGECDNPTEAGASKDGNRYPRASSSRLEISSVAGNELNT